jgi:hypothetical protein
MIFGMSAFSRDCPFCRAAERSFDISYTHLELGSIMELLGFKALGSLQTPSDLNRGHDKRKSIIS